MITIKKLLKKYDNRVVLDEISFDIAKGDFIGIMGQSGSGKTTLLNSISTIDNEYSGQILYDGVNISNLSERELAEFRNTKIGIVFQEYNLIDCLTVYENIIIALTFSKLNKHEQNRKVIDVVRKLDIEKIIDKYPCEISGGQRQRVACARAIIKQPYIILADEPTGALDTLSTKSLLKTLAHLNFEFNETILMVTHEPLAASYCKKTLFMEEGRIKKELVKGKKNQRDYYREILNELIKGEEVIDEI